MRFLYAKVMIASSFYVIFQDYSRAGGFEQGYLKFRVKRGLWRPVILILFLSSLRCVIIATY